MSLDDDALGELLDEVGIGLDLNAVGLTLEPVRLEGQDELRKIKRDMAALRKQLAELDQTVGRARCQKVGD